MIAVPLRRLRSETDETAETVVDTQIPNAPSSGASLRLIQNNKSFNVSRIERINDIASEFSNKIGLGQSSTEKDDTDCSGKTKERDQAAGILEKLFYIASFFFSGPLLIMSNKNILSNIGFAFPLSLSFLTLSFSWFVCMIAVHVYGLELKHKELVDRRFYLTNILPIGALSAGTIVMGMASYLFLTVSFVQMIKAFTPCITMGFMVSFGLNRPTREAIACVLVICLGTAIAGFGEVHFSFLGMGCIICAQICEALKLVYTQVMLKSFKFDVVETLYYVTPISAVWVLVFAAIIEFPTLDWSAVHEMIFANKGAFLFSAVMAVSVNAINAVVIQYTNALMLKLIATARNGLLVLFNAMVLGEIVTQMQLFGYSLSLVGFVCYNISIRRNKDKKEKKHLPTSAVK